MINPTNPGAILPFYIESGSQMAHSRQVSRHADGWKIFASNQKLIPFIFWEPTTPNAVLKFQAINIETGRVHSLSTGLIDRRKRTDNSKTWYLFDGSDIGAILPCGTYKIRIEFALTSYISDEIQVVNAQGPEYMALAPTGCVGNILTIVATETLESTLEYEMLEYKYSGGGSWVEISPTSSAPYTFPFNLGAVTLPPNQNLILRHTARTSAGSVLRMLYALSYTNADPCGTYTLYLISDESTYTNGDLWYLEIADSPLWDDKIYEAGFVERVYFKGYWDFPEQEREVEILTDNQANAVLNTADTREFLVMAMGKIADHLLYKLNAIGDYSTISLTNVFTGYSITAIPGAETQFTSEKDAGGYYSTGKLRFRDQKHFETACTTSETTTAV